MLTRWRSGFGAIAVLIATVALVVLDVTDDAVRHWWVDHALTTDSVAGLLVLLITVLVVNQAIGLRQARDRSRAVAAQAVIIVRQALRATSAVSTVLDGSGAHDDASEEIRSFMLLLLVSAPVLIDATVSRTFLEQAQHLGAEMVRLLASFGRERGAAAVSRAGVDEAVSRLRVASVPLLAVLDLDEQTVMGRFDPGSD